MIRQLRVDAAVAGAQALVEKVAPALTRAERKGFRKVAVRILVAMLEAYDQQAQRTVVRIEPSKN